MDPDRRKRGAAGLLSLAAAPTFAAMALATGLLGHGRADTICSAGPAVSPAVSLLGGMALMYALMSVFHCAPWLRLVSGASVLRKAWSPPCPRA